MARSVALISLYPLNNIGGGERYTFCTSRSVRAAGDQCRIYARSSLGPGVLPFSERLDLSFTEFKSENEPIRRMSLRDILLSISGFDIIWVHQYLSSDAVFDVISAVTSDQQLFFTNLGHEVLFSQFQAFYCRAPNHFLIEISEYAAKRAACFRGRSLGVTGAIWSNEFLYCDSSSDTADERKRICSIGRVLPHKGIDVTIAGLPNDWRLDVIGPLEDKAYLAHLQKLANGKSVHFAGPVPEEVKKSALFGSLCLVASSCHETYDGKTIPQAELLGLVIFEAITVGTLAVTSDIPSFQEIMTRLGLADLVYHTRDATALKQVLCWLTLRDRKSRDTLLQNAKDVIRREYLWDDYWPRVLSSTAS